MGLAVQSWPNLASDLGIRANSMRQLAPALIMALGPVLTTQPDQYDNRIKDRQTQEDFCCGHRALTGQRGPTDQDLGGLYL